jgi:hypothetical protein
LPQVSAAGDSSSAFSLVLSDARLRVADFSETETVPEFALNEVTPVAAKASSA